MKTLGVLITVFCAVLIAWLVLSGGIDIRSTKNALAAPTQIIHFSDRSGTSNYSVDLLLDHSCYEVTMNVLPDETGGVRITADTKNVWDSSRACTKIPTIYSRRIPTDLVATGTPRLFVDGVERPVSVTERMWNDPHGQIYSGGKDAPATTTSSAGE